MSIVDELSNKTVFELRSYAKQNNIDLFGVNKKVDILEIILNFIPKEESKPVVVEQPKEKVALYSTRNIHWTGVGELKIGYNIVTKEQADQWITKKSIREATPEEVKRAYGK
jgi:pSer/pThr/pTyr-binding forkhead associated (FHA) protein